MNSVPKIASLDLDVIADRLASACAAIQVVSDAVDRHVRRDRLPTSGILRTWVRDLDAAVELAHFIVVELRSSADVSAGD